MTTAIIGTGGIGSVIARQLASGGETLRLSSADIKPARTLAAEIGRAAVVAVNNRDALQDADAVVLMSPAGRAVRLLPHSRRPDPQRGQHQARLTEHSQVPKMFAAAGLPYPELLDRLVSDALSGPGAPL